MAVTSYYSVNGMLMGEKPSGSGRVDYLSDALGSVTATVNASATVVNTYRYKPYGTQLAKTGSGSDPAFTWVGQWGYRQTNRQFSDVYVRARHYSSIAGMWTSKDLLINQTGLSPYAYVRISIVTLIDPSGLIEITTSRQPQADCAGVSWGVRFTANSSTKFQKWWIIQRVKVTWDVFDCKTFERLDPRTPPGMAKYPSGFEYYESWDVSPPPLRTVTPLTGESHDIFSITFESVNGMCGSVSFEGTVYEARHDGRNPKKTDDCPDGLVKPPGKGSVWWSGGLCSSTDPPKNVQNRFPEKRHVLYYSWYCCAGVAKCTLFHTDPNSFKPELCP